VREGRRIIGEYVFTAHDALPLTEKGRPPLHADSITASHYALDSHATRKREPDRASLEGFFSHPCAPYTVPYRVIVPTNVEGLLVPVAASSTHVGFSTLRMEPCWMALGEAAGIAASVALSQGESLRRIDVALLQRKLLQHRAVLLYFRDIDHTHPHYEALQMLGLRGLLPEWNVHPDKPVLPEEAKRWTEAAGLKTAPPATSPSTRAEFLHLLWEQSTSDGPSSVVASATP
jgi:hypothetical protein